ncbi:hypothetical protein GCM10027586_02300 [Kineococcus gypseus]|uniref:hypothetical protein n=1 Tax=Kineococcus gypseus TaxID=1637102 RepID=UPI003D7D82FE
MREVVVDVTLTPDGRTTGPGGNADMGRVLPHAFDDGVREHLARITSTATTAPMGSVAVQLLRPDLVDMLTPVLVPEVLGGGRVLFEDVVLASSWHLVEHAAGASGVLVLIYRRRRVGGS